MSKIDKNPQEEINIDQDNIATENSSAISDVEKNDSFKAVKAVKDTSVNKVKDRVKKDVSQKTKKTLGKLKTKEKVAGSKKIFNIKKLSKTKALLGGKILLIALLIIWVIGIIMALIFIPAMMKEGFVQGVVGLLKKATTKAKGAEGKIYKEDVYKLGDYARSKGFQLYSDGFIYEKAPKDKTPEGSRYIPEEGIAVDEENKITLLEYEGSPLKRYALMNAYTYTMENEKNGVLSLIANVISGIGDGVSSLSKILSGEGLGRKNGDKFDGMIRMEESPWDPEKDANLSEEQIAAKVFDKKADKVGISWADEAEIKIDVDKKIMSIRFHDFANPYIFNIEGWAGRYGMPTEFLLALHKSIMAPDLIYELTNGTKLENDREYLKTKMIIRLIRAKGNIEGGIMVPEDTSINGKLYDSAGNEVNIKDINFDKVKDGSVVYYAKTGKPDSPRLFPLKTTDGPVSLTLPKDINEDDGTPKPDSESKYDITQMYIDIEEKKVRRIGGYVVNAQEVKAYLATALNVNWFGSATNKAEAFVLNFGLHNLVRRYNEEFGETSMAKFADTLEEAVNVITENNYKAYMPLIYKVKDHWFRDVYFYMNEGEKYTLINEDEFIKKGEYWTKFKGKNAEGTGSGKDKEVDYKTTDKAWSAYKLEPRNLEDGKLNYKTYQIDEDDDKVNEAIKKLQKLGDVVQIKEDFNLQVTQTEDGRRGETNKRTKDLFAKEKWYIYDGTEDTANQINKRRKEKGGGEDERKKKLTKDMDLLAGSLMLENMDSIDSEYAYRDYKELLLELDYYTVDDLSQRIRRVLTWPVPSASVGRTWPDTKGTKDETEFGVSILPKEEIEKLLEKDLKDESGNPLSGEAKEKAMAKAKENYGEGFEEGKEVVAPATGKITKKEANKIEIQILNNKDNVSEYKDFYEDEYKNGCAGYKITIENIDVSVEDKSMYKPQLSNKEIERLSTEEQRKKVKEKEDRKKDAPNTVGEYIKEGTVIGKTKKEKIKIYMSNLDDEVVEHVDKYLLVPYANFQARIMEDYLTKIIDGEPNQIPDGDVETFRKMFPKENYPVIYENAEAFLEMQTKYGVNAIFAAVVSIVESNGGTNWNAIPKTYNNIFSITGSPGSSGEHYTGVGPSRPGSSNNKNWRMYPSVRESILDFGKLIAESKYYHKAGRFYVSEIGQVYIEASGINEWVNNTNGLITAALKRYINSGDEPSSNENNNQKQNQDNNKDNGSKKGSDDSATEEEYQSNPFDLLGAQNQGTLSDEPSSFRGMDKVTKINGVDYLNGTYYFNQCDNKYKGTSYGGKSVMYNACGPFAAAIAFSTATGKPLDPVDIMNYAVQKGDNMPGGGSKWSLFTHLGQRYNVPVRATASSAEADNALDNGCVVIASQRKGYWARTGHFVVILKRLPGGKYLVNDPASVRRSTEDHDRNQMYKDAKQFFIIGPTDNIRKMQREGLAPTQDSSSSASKDVKAVFDDVAREKGVTPEEKEKWAYIIEKESGWKVDAKYKKAYGLPQANPGNKMAEKGADWRTNPRTQLLWMYDYMNKVYGGITGAYNKKKRDNWY